MPLPLAAMLVPAAFNTGLGIYQAIKGNKLSKTERPDYEIPQELQDALLRSKELASMRHLPSESLIMDRIRGTGASASDAIRKTATGGEALGVLGDIYSGEQRKLTDLGIAGEQNWLKNQSNLTTMQNLYAKEQNQQWNWNVGSPYLKTMDTASKLMSGGLQNISAGLNSAANSIALKYNENPYFFKELLSKIANTINPGDMSGYMSDEDITGGILGKVGTGYTNGKI